MLRYIENCVSVIKHLVSEKIYFFNLMNFTKGIMSIFILLRFMVYYMYYVHFQRDGIVCWKVVLNWKHLNITADRSRERFKNNYIP